MLPTNRRRDLQNRKLLSDQYIPPSDPHPLLSDPLFDPSLLTDDAARVIQSNICSTHERQNGIQCFDELPHDEYTVPLNDTVNMRCVVLNQHGKVQWRAKKILLGYDRSIPGYPRYRIIGDVERGEHTLQIMAVQLDDAGEYECQVTPVPANNHPLLRRKTNLLVLIKPSRPVILYPDVPPPDNQLIISEPDPIKKMTVLCVSTGGSPPPTFTWIVNDKIIPPKFTQYINPKRIRGPWTQLAPYIENIGDEESRLTLLKSGVSDGDELICSVKNAATNKHHDVREHNLTTRVLIRIHTPPGPPVIISPNTNQEFMEGDELKAICVASPPGNPFGGLFWRWLLQSSQLEHDTITGHIHGLGGHGGARLSEYNAVQAYLQTMDKPGINQLSSNNFASDLISEDVQPLHYTLKKEKDRLVNTVIIPRLTRRYHAAKLVCETGHPVGNAQQTNVKIYVKYAPHNVTIDVEGSKVSEEYVSGRREFVVYGRAGEVKSLICRTGPYYKQATIKWIAQSADSSLTKPPRQLFGQTKSLRTGNGESWYQESRVDVRITDEDDRGYIDCRVWGEGDSRIDARVRLDIIYPPEKPLVTGYKSFQPIKMAHTMELACISRGGNPPPELVWFRDKQPMPPTEQTLVIGKQSSLKLKLVPQKEDNGAHYHCSARNAATDAFGVSSDSFILNVIFPPQLVSINFNGPSIVSTGQPLVISCKADTSNPVATITWWHFRCGPAHASEVYGDTNLLQLQKNNPSRLPGQKTKCKSEQVEGTEEKPTHGTAGGLHAHSRLWLRPTWHYHMDFIECRAENLQYGPPIWHDRLQLNITFPPQFLGLQASHEKVIREGESTTLDIGAYANPSIQSFHWMLNGQTLPFIPTTGEVEPGVYTSGDIGEFLTLKKIKRNHMDNYTIVANNLIGETRTFVYLNVTYPAGILGKSVENVSEATTELTAHLDCLATANPADAAKAFKWYRYMPAPGWPQDVNEAAVQISPPIACNESSSVPTTNDKVFILCENEGRTQIKSRLTIYKTSSDDVGAYICEVNNGLGEAVRKKINFLHPFPPTIIQLPRYTKAAGIQGSSVILTCLILTEPTPRVVWLKEERLLERVPTSNKHDFGFDHLRPGLYKATLTVNNLQKSDFGAYRCQVVNIKGEAVLDVRLTGTSTPDVPLNLRLLNATMTSLMVAWTQGFDGGLSQTFQVRWKQTDSQQMFRYADVAANDNHHAVNYLITGLEPDTKYMISVNSMNTKHGASTYTDFITVKTLSYDEISGNALRPPLSQSEIANENALLIIVAASIFGFVIISVNLIVISFIIKRRRQRRLLARRGKVGTGQDGSVQNGYYMSNMCNSGQSDEGFKYSSTPTNETGVSHSDSGCACCSLGRSKDMQTSYVKSHPMDPFVRTNGHIGHYPERVRLNRLQHQSSITSDPLLFQSPISAAAAFGDNRLGFIDNNGSHPIQNMNTTSIPRGISGSMEFRPNSPTAAPISYFGSPRERLLSRKTYNQHTPRRGNQALYNESIYRNNTQTSGTRCGSFSPSIAERKRLFPATYHSMSSLSGVGKTRDMESTYPDNNKSFYHNQRVYPRTMKTLKFQTRPLHQTKRHHEIYTSPNFYRSEPGHSSDGENGYAQERYAEQLRRVQYGNGPTVNLILGANYPSTSHISPMGRAVFHNPNPSTSATHTDLRYLGRSRDDSYIPHDLR